VNECGTQTSSRNDAPATLWQSVAAAARASTGHAAASADGSRATGNRSLLRRAASACSCP